MGIFRTNDPTQFDDIDGIIIDEQTPPSSINGIATNVAILIGQFQRGPEALSISPIGSIGEFQEIYGKSNYSGNKQLKNKAFGQLKIIRAVASDAAKAQLVHDAKLQFDAKYKGTYGNSLSVEIQNASGDVQGVTGAAEVVDVTAIADVGGDLESTGFLVRSPDQVFGFYYSIGVESESQIFAFQGGVTGASFDVDGAAEKMQLSDVGYLWFNVTDGANNQTDPGGDGVGFQVDILSADANTVINTKAKAVVNNDAAKKLMKYYRNGAGGGTTFNASFVDGDRPAGSTSNAALITYTQGSEGSNGSGTPPADVAAADVVVPLRLTANNTDSQNAGSIIGAIQALSYAFSENNNSPTARIISNDDGAAIDASDSVNAATGFTFAVITQGVTPVTAVDDGVRIIIRDEAPDAILPAEIYDNLNIADIVPATFANSNLVDVTVLDTASEPAVLAKTNLAGGSDGTIADTDYEAAIALAEEERSGNFLFLDEYNAARNEFLKIHVAATQDKIAIIAGQETDDADAAILDVPNYRDTDGRIIYAWPYVQTRINGALEFTNPASWYASVVSQTSPHIAPSFNANTKFLPGIVDLKFKVSRNKHIALDAAGVSAFERDADVGFVIKNAVTTQILNSAKREVIRRRMADFLTNSIALFLKNYQNGVNAQAKRDEVKAQILDFDTRLVRDGILPGSNEIQGGDVVLVDTDSLNTNSVIAQGMFKILYRRRIFSSMRYIVLQADISTGVVVTDVSQ